MNQSTSDMIAIADSSAFAAGPRRTASAAPRRRPLMKLVPSAQQRELGEGVAGRQRELAATFGGAQ